MKRVGQLIGKVWKKSAEKNDSSGMQCLILEEHARLHFVILKSSLS